MHRDPTVDANGRPFRHATFPAHTPELFLKVRAYLERTLGADLRTKEGRQRLQDAAARLVALAREEYGHGHGH